MITPRPLFCLFLAAGMLLPALLRAEDPPLLPLNEEVRDLLRQRIDVEKRGVSIVVGLVDEQGSRIVAYGHPSKGGEGTVSPTTIYEIGSVTKTFTDLVLADMVLKGEVKLDDPASKYLPADAKLPARGGREITLLDLATHRSGLPRMPDQPHPSNPADPMADYAPAQLYAFLSGYELTRDIGSKMEYSNLGVGLLGHLLARRADRAYEQLVKERVCYPLGLKTTGVTLSSTMRPRVAQPYDETLKPTSMTNIATLTGAGGLRSDMEDMLKFVSAELGLTPSPLADAMQETQKPRAATNSPTTDLALGWFIDRSSEPPMWWHNGGTSGYHAWVGFRPATKTGVVVLANTALDVDDLGRHLLDSRFPLTAPPKQRTAIEIKPEVADRYVGRYGLAPDFVLTFSREGERYFIVAADQPKDEVFPESEVDFFSKSFDGQVTFVPDADGKCNALILHQAGVPDQVAKRLP